MTDTIQMPPEERLEMAETLESLAATLADDPRAVSVDEFVDTWDRAWNQGRQHLIDALAQGSAMLRLTSVPMDADALKLLGTLMQNTMEAVEALSEDNAPSFEQRMEARAIRIERKLDDLLEKVDRL